MTPKDRAMDSVKTVAKWKLVPVVPTPEMIEAGDVANPTAWNEDTDLGFGCDVAFEVYRAMLAASPAGAEVVRVKPLVWHDHPAGGKQAVAAGLGLYRVHINGKSWYLNQDYMGEGGEAAVQADYERRVLSALEPTPSTDAVRRQEREEWNFDMDAAPKDGTRILIWFVHANAKFSKDPVGEGWACAHEAHWIDFNGGGWTWHGLCGAATAWRHMPQPPPTLSTPPAGAAALNEGESDANLR